MALKSWIASANNPATEFPIESLPYGVFRYHDQNHIGVAIGDQILDLHACANQALLAPLPDDIVLACRAPLLNPLMSLGSNAWSALRRCITSMLDTKRADGPMQRVIESLLVPIHNAVMQVPAVIGDYTDFYASLHHAMRVGKLFRPDHPLLPNYKYIPIGYHGRASSIVLSGHSICRPFGQIKSSNLDPVFEPARSLDYELEMGIFVGPGNQLGQRIPIEEAEKHIFGLCLVNDWSARDIQSWEYQPLGPFLAKSFATTISPWIVPMEALAPYRVAIEQRPPGDPKPLPYLSSPTNGLAGIDVTLEVFLDSSSMRQAGMAPMLMSRANLDNLYWTIAQLITHHASNGCNLRPGDLLATGTISGPDKGSEGCLLEKKQVGNSVRLPSGESRTFLEDGDRVIFRAHAKKEGFPTIGFGECAGSVIGPAQ